MHETYAEAAQQAASQGLVAGNPLQQPLAVAREAQRRYQEALVDLGEVKPIAEVTNTSLPGPFGPIPVRLSYPKTPAPLPVVIHVRGGGWWSGSLDASTGIVNHIASASDCTVCSIDYRFAPEHRYPTQLEELLSVLSGLRQNAQALRIQPTPPVLLGESAGASLCLAAAMRLRDAGETSPSGLVQFYTNALGLPANALPLTQWIWDHYLPETAEVDDRYASPLRNDVSGLPPMWLGVGELDHLLVDTLTLAERCEAAGIPYALHRYEGLPHAFLQFATTLRPAARSLDDASAFIRRIASSAPAS